MNPIIHLFCQFWPSTVFSYIDAAVESRHQRRDPAPANNQNSFRFKAGSSPSIDHQMMKETRPRSSSEDELTAVWPHTLESVPHSTFQHNVCTKHLAGTAAHNESQQSLIMGGCL